MQFIFVTLLWLSLSPARVCAVWQNWPLAISLSNFSICAGSA
ncbi:hypothetical protein Z949_114 [Sulfitobacter guttiformis KCTC 32187]|nr:hypothetical protein Z949_114 [Sulfitobacter guttiformis KCTC 32187]